ncbi:hypothetical protein M514_00299, partial [Trichuris suis]
MQAHILFCLLILVCQTRAETVSSRTISRIREPSSDIKDAQGLEPRWIGWTAPKNSLFHVSPSTHDSFVEQRELTEEELDKSGKRTKRRVTLFCRIVRDRRTGRTLTICKRIK